MMRRNYFLGGARAPVCMLLAVVAIVALAVTGCGDQRRARTSEPSSALSDPAHEDSRKAVLFLGDSLSAGYGLRADQSFPALLQRYIDDAQLPFRIVNAGVSGDTTAGGLRRIDWLLRQPLDTLVIQLGGNDMLRGQDVSAMRANLRGIAEKTRAVYPDAAIVVSGMRAAPNLGGDYARAYRDSFAGLAEELGAAYVPFLLDGVAANTLLNQADGIHPTAAGHRIVAETVWRVLGPLLRERRSHEINSTGS